MAVQLINVSNPAAFGIEWREGANTYELVNPRGTTILIWGAKNYDVDGGWTTTTVDRPARFGMRTAPQTFAEFRRIVDAFIAG